MIGRRKFKVSACGLFTVNISLVNHYKQHKFEKKRKNIYQCNTNRYITLHIQIHPL